MQTNTQSARELPAACFDAQGQLTLLAFGDIDRKLQALGFARVEGRLEWRHESGARAGISGKMLVRKN